MRKQHPYQQIKHKTVVKSVIQAYHIADPTTVKPHETPQTITKVKINTITTIISQKTTKNKHKICKHNLPQNLSRVGQIPRCVSIAISGIMLKIKTKISTKVV